MAYETVDCVDAGTDYCPCYLAETNNCLICSQLQGKVFCDCINWKGVCIYQEYVWNGNKQKDPRESSKVNILEKKKINDKVLFMKLKVSRTLARELNQPGSYIFIRNENHPNFFDAPMSIMYSDEINETVDLLIQLRGVKTKSLEDCSSQVIIRGPYWNGIMGLKDLKMVKDSNCLIVARGMGQAASVLVAKKLRSSGNNVFVVLDGGSTETTYSKKYFENLGCHVTEARVTENRIFDENAGLIIMDIISRNDITLIFSGGTDILHRGLIQLKNRATNSILFACTNNSNMCCGEGVCGSCSVRIKDGKRVKCCKAQVDPVSLVGGIN